MCSSNVSCTNLLLQFTHAHLTNLPVAWLWCNTILVLPYPSTKKNCDWWTKYSFDKTYIIACLPFIVDREKKANAVIISKHYPELEKGNDYFYLSKNKIIDKRLKLEAKANKSFLYKTNAIIKNTEMKFIGSSTKRYEVK